MEPTVESPRKSRDRLSKAIALANRLGGVPNLALPVWLDIAEIVNLTGLSESSIRRMERTSEFPHLSRIGPRRRGITLRAYMDWSDRCEKGVRP